MQALSYVLAYISEKVEEGVTPDEIAYSVTCKLYPHIDLKSALIMVHDVLAFEKVWNETLEKVTINSY